MKNFLNKEIKLCLSGVNYLFLLFSLMMLIPNYPYYVPFFYICLSVFFIFNNAELNKDIAYSMILPITKGDIVKSRCILVCFYEVVFTLLTIPFAILGRKLVPQGNQAGIDANVAFYGLVLICLSIFNFIFFTKYYKKAEKPGLPFLFASIGYFVVYLLFDSPVIIKGIIDNEFIYILDSTDSASLVKQIPILILGILIFIGCWFATYKKSIKNFEKVDL